MAETQKTKVTRGSILIPAARIERRIFLIRGQKVMLSGDLAELYGVPAKQLNQAVARNRERFPADFMFQLSWAEAKELRSQLVTLGSEAHFRFRPYAFTEEGVAMLSAVLRSPTAVAVSIEIMRVFVRLRKLLSSHHQLRRKLDSLERKLAEHDKHFAVVFDAIRQLMSDDEAPPKARIGYDAETRNQ